MIGDWIALYYELFLTLYDDPDVAAVATAATINHLLTQTKRTTTLHKRQLFSPYRENSVL